MSKKVDRLAYEHQVELVFFRLGKPTDNPYIKLFNGSFRDECLNAHWFLSLEDAKEKMKSGGKNTTTSGTTAVWGI
ncbi:integrase core domain-containing protein [Sphingobacterium sp. Lzh-3]|uniref:integrase core domain-containing protein n=1 Tax=Sphingobacterium sp. Lzh-3 TaxID=3382150 RepID=UPI00398CF84F